MGLWCGRLRSVAAIPIAVGTGKFRFGLGLFYRMGASERLV